jgi:uncharacterized RDD family membrane protein YckC
MQNVRIQTTQNVFIEYEAASVGDRIVAGLVDWMILGAYWFIVYEIIENIHLRSDVDRILFMLALIPHTFYHVMCEIFLGGQSIGKKIRKIKVARLDGKHPTVGNYILRWILRPVDMFPGFYGMGIVAISSNGMGQRLGDMAAGTTVLNLQRRINWEDMLPPASEEEYAPVFLQVTSLTDRDISLIEEVKDIAETNPTRNAEYLLQHTAHKVKQLLKTETEMLPAEFLDTVLKDYTYLTGK